MAEVLPLERSEHVVSARQAVRQRAVDLGFSLVDQTKIITAASELARNTIQHGGGGRAIVETITDGRRSGLRLTFEDHGPAGCRDLSAGTPTRNDCALRLCGGGGTFDS